MSDSWYTKKHDELGQWDIEHDTEESEAMMRLQEKNRALLKENEILRTCLSQEQWEKKQLEEKIKMFSQVKELFQDIKE